MKNIAPYIICLLLVVIIFLRECRPDPERPCPEPITDTLISVITKVDTFEVEIPGKPVLDTVYDSVPVFIADTSEVIDDYFRVRKYKLRLRKDSVADLTFHGTVYKNNLLDDAWLDGEIFQKTRVETKIIKEPLRRKLFAGALISYPLPTSEGNFSLSAGLMYMTKHDNVYQATYDPFNKTVTGGMFFKIKFK